jgi:hypothetical protein
MNSDSESLQNQLLAWLIAGDNALTNGLSSENCEEINGVENTIEAAASQNGGDFESVWTPQSFKLGEIPTVQERFQTVLKRRLQTQIQKNPPLFPWETQLIDYPDYVDNPSLGIVPGWGWAGQQSKLNLPISLPEKVFQHLLERCQALVASSLPLGAKLVQAVESLFPDDSQALNDLAGLVLRSPYRSVAALEKMPSLESGYSDLQIRQKIALSLLAAKQLLENLSVTVSAENPLALKEWQTSAGLVNLKIEFLTWGNHSNLRVEAQLPTQGVLKLQGNNSQTTSQTSVGGCVSVELCCTQPSQTYTLEVDLKGIDQQPLVFAIAPIV